MFALICMNSSNVLHSSILTYSFNKLSSISSRTSCQCGVFMTPSSFRKWSSLSSVFLLTLRYFCNINSVYTSTVSVDHILVISLLVNPSPEYQLCFVQPSSFSSEEIYSLISFSVLSFLLSPCQILVVF